MKPLITASLITALASPVAAQAIRKHGTCPDGYLSSGSDFCEPSNSRSGPAFFRGDRSCPDNYTTSGLYCVGQERAKDAFPRRGNETCPGGYHSSGGACEAY